MAEANTTAYGLERDVDPYTPSPEVDAARVGHMRAFWFTSHCRGFSPQEWS